MSYRTDWRHTRSRSGSSHRRGHEPRLDESEGCTEMAAVGYKMGGQRNDALGTRTP
jgi:hypothetical protein